jgi:HEAT repeat protein
MLVWILLALLPLPQDEVRELIDRLRSDDAEQRTRATLALKKVGAPAVPLLELAARDSDLEVATRARSALNSIALIGRIPPRFAATFPGVEDRLMAGEDRVAADLLTEAAGRLEDGGGALRIEDLQWIAPAAVRGAASARFPIDTVLPLVKRYRLNASVFEVLDLLDDPADDVRFLAMDTLTGLGGERPEAAYFGDRSLADDQIVRVVLTALEGQSRAQVGGTLLRELESQKSRRRRIAIRGLARLDVKAAVPTILAHVEDPSDAVRAEVLVAVGELDARDAAPLVLRHLADPSARVRGAAARAAGNLRDPRAVPALLAFLSDADSDLQGEACLALGTLRAPDAVTPMIRLFADGGGSARLSAAQGLRRYDGARVAPALIRETAGKALEVRLRAVELVGELDAAAATSALAPLLSRDEPQELRLETLRALMRTGSAEAKPALVPLLEDPSPPIRSMAARALAELGADDVAPRLVESLAAEDPNAKYHAVMGLAALGTASAAPKIVPIALSPRNPDWLRVAALRVMERTGSADDLRALRPLLEDPLYEIRSTAAKVLCWRGDGEAVGVVFEETRNWICLNAIRKPQEWAALTALPVGEDLRGSRREVLERLARKADLTVEWPAPGEVRGPDLDVPCTLQARRKSVAEALREPLPTGVEVVVERDRIRVLSRESASEFWKAWRDKRGR